MALCFPLALPGNPLMEFEPQNRQSNKKPKKKSSNTSSNKDLEELMWARAMHVEDPEWKGFFYQTDRIADCGANRLRLLSLVWIQRFSVPRLFCCALEPEITRNRYLTIISTDKPVYRPGEVVHVRIVLLHAVSFTPIAGALSLADRLGLTVHLSLQTGNGQKTLATVYLPNRLQGSSWHEEICLPNGISGGWYEINVTYSPLLYDTAGSFNRWTTDVAPGIRKFQIRSYTAPTFRITIQLAKEIAVPGEALSFIVSVARIDKLALSESAQLDYELLMDGKSSKERCHTCALTTECVACTVQVPKIQTEDSEAALLVTVRDAGSTQSLRKRVPLIAQADSSVKLQFYPEGGSLVAGLQNCVYICATDKIGKPIEVRGEIRTTGHPAVTDAAFVTSSRGKAKVYFTPTADPAVAVVFVGGATSSEHLLPCPQQKGVAMFVREPVMEWNDVLSLDIGSTDATKCNVVVCRLEKVLVAQPLALSAGQQQRLSVAIPMDCYGVLRVTILENDDVAPNSFGNPLAERLVLRKPPKHRAVKPRLVRVQAGIGDWIECEDGNLPKDFAVAQQTECTLCLEVRDQAGQPRSALASATVIDEKALAVVCPDEVPPRLQAAALLESDLNDVPRLDELWLDSSALDLELGTAGWRQFMYLRPLLGSLQKGLCYQRATVRSLHESEKSEKAISNLHKELAAEVKKMKELERTRQQKEDTQQSSTFSLLPLFHRREPMSREQQAKMDLAKRILFASNLASALAAIDASTAKEISGIYIGEDTLVHQIVRRNKWSEPDICALLKRLAHIGVDVDAPQLAVQLFKRKGGGELLTPLHVAIHARKTRVVEALITSKANLTARDGLGMSAMDIACGTGNVDIVKLLLRHLSVNDLATHWADQPNPQTGFTPAHWAALSGSRAVCALIAEGAKNSAKGFLGNTVTAELGYTPSLLACRELGTAGHVRFSANKTKTENTQEKDRRGFGAEMLSQLHESGWMKHRRCTPYGTWSWVVRPPQRLMVHRKGTSSASTLAVEVTPTTTIKSIIQRAVGDDSDARQYVLLDEATNTLLAHETFHCAMPVAIVDDEANMDFNTEDYKFCFRFTEPLEGQVERWLDDLVPHHGTQCGCFASVRCSEDGEHFETYFTACVRVQNFPVNESWGGEWIDLRMSPFDLGLSVGDTLYCYCPLLAHLPMLQSSVHETTLGDYYGHYSPKLPECVALLHTDVRGALSQAKWTLDGKVQTDIVQSAQVSVFDRVVHWKQSLLALIEQTKPKAKQSKDVDDEGVELDIVLHHPKGVTVLLDTFPMSYVVCLPMSGSTLDIRTRHVQRIVDYTKFFEFFFTSWSALDGLSQEEHADEEQEEYEDGDDDEGSGPSEDENGPRHKRKAHRGVSQKKDNAALKKRAAIFQKFFPRFAAIVQKHLLRHSSYFTFVRGVSDLDATDRMMMLTEAESNLNDITCEFEMYQDATCEEEGEYGGDEDDSDHEGKEKPKRDNASVEVPLEVESVRPVVPKARTLVWYGSAVRVFSHARYEHRDEATRSDFAETLYFSAMEAVTPEKTLRIAFFTADSVTSYRVMVDVVTADGCFGEADFDFRCVRPFFLDFAIPQQVGCGDQLQIPVVVRNESGLPIRAVTIDPKNMSSAFECTPPTQTLTQLAHGSQGQVVFGMLVKGVKSKRTNAIHFSADADRGTFMDTVFRTTEVLDTGFPVQLHYSCVIDSNTTSTFKIVLPKPVSHTASALIELSSSPAYNIEQSLEHSMCVASGCGEQVTSKCFMSLMAVKCAKQFSFAPKFLARAHALLDINAGRLLEHQARDGGVAYFGTDTASLVVTAYAINAMTQWTKLGISSSGRLQSLLSSSMNLVRRLLKCDESGTPCCFLDRTSWWCGVASTALSILFDLSEAGCLEFEQQLLWAEKNLKNKELHDVALLSILHCRYGKASRAREELSAVRQRSEAEMGKGVSAFGVSGAYISMETSALLAIAAFLLKDNEFGKLEVRRVILASSRGYFGPSHTTVLCLQALSLFYEAYPDLIASMSNLNAEVCLNGRLIGKCMVGQKMDFSDRVDHEGTYDLQVVGTPGFVPVYIEVAMLSTTPLNTNTGGLALTVAIDGPTEVAQGSVVRVVATISNVSSRAGMTIVEVGLPAALQPSAQQLDALLLQMRQLKRYELNPRIVTLYIEALDAGETLRIPVDCIAEFAGSYCGVASAAYTYYRPGKVWAPGVTLQVSLRR